MQKRFFLIIILIGIAIDMTIKYLVQLYLQDAFFLIPGWIEFKLAYNSGIAFSLPLQGLLLQIITLILIFSIIVHYSNTERRKKSNLLDIGYSLLLAGAISHAYERIVVGYVVDFIAVKYFAVFNFADIFISVGVLLIVLFYAKKPR